MALPKFSLAERVKSLWPYAATVALVLLGAGTRLALNPIAGDLYTFTIFYAIVPLIAWRYGLGFGLLALGLSALVANYALLEPAWGFDGGPHVILGMLLFLLIGFGLAVLGNGIRRSRRELRTKTAELEREVSERKAAEADVARLNALLAERVDELQAVINASPIAIGVADTVSEHIWGNEAFTDMLGVARDADVSPASPEAARLPFKIYRNGIEAVPAELPMRQSASQGVSVRNAEIDMVRADGRRLTLLGNAAPLHRATGEIRGSVGVFVDITERRAAERERDEASRRKDEFLATLAHELRNPLAPLRNAAAIIAQRHGDERLKGASEVIERQVVHMTRLVDDLLDVARMTRGLITLRKEYVDLRAPVSQAVELVSPLIQARKHRLHVELPPQRLPLHVDRVRFAQVITNILTNAAKYTPEGGSILITATEERSMVKLKIRDSGIGISAELLPKVFDLFVQGDRSLARTEGGLGIGLTLVRRIVELHEGKVEARSAGPDKGAEFIVSVPLAAEAAAARTLEPGPQDVGRQRILIVDDNADVADTLSVLLAMIGHEAKVAYTAEEALDIAPRFRPALAFFDIGLPGMNGYELARRFRADPELQQVHLIALTGYGRMADRTLSTEAGFEVHLTKPFDPDRLEKLVQEVLAGRPPSAPPPTSGFNDESETIAPDL